VHRRLRDWQHKALGAVPRATRLKGHMDRSRNGRTTPTRSAATLTEGRAKQRAYLIAALDEGDDLSELRELLSTAGVAVVGQAVQHRDKPHPNTYLGPGKLIEVKAAAHEADANVIVCDDELSPRQERNLEKELGMSVVDRTATILDIFAAHANTAEGKLQVELAQLEYNLARMRGLWTHLERLGGVSSGGFATRGPGESQIETDRRLARDRIAALRRRLEHVKGTRAVQRAERERAHLPQVALAGYTNAGKSTLLNAMTGSAVGVRNRLFHTLDPTTRQLQIEGRPYLLTDTVGFIRKLPHQLVDAFGATLEETRVADLILHVVDASAPEEDRLGMMRAVEDVLEEIGAGERPRLLVLNKVDALDAAARLELSHRHRGAVTVSALTGEGLDALADAIEEAFKATMRPMDLLVPYAEGASLAELHEVAGEMERTDTPEGVRVHALVPVGLVHTFERFDTANGNGNHA
jgi:GTPase